MSHTPQDRIRDLERQLASVRLVQAHYPNARLDKIRDIDFSPLGWRDPLPLEWFDPNAQSHVDHFEVVVLRGARCLAPYHLIKDGDVEARVFAEPWRADTVAEAVKADSDINAKVWTLLRTKP